MHFPTSLPRCWHLAKTRVCFDQSLFSIPLPSDAFFKWGVRITQVFLNLIRRVHCVSPPSLLCLQLCLHLMSFQNFYVIGGAGNVRKFACCTRNHCGSNECCERSRECSENAGSDSDTAFQESVARPCPFSQSSTSTYRKRSPLHGPTYSHLNANRQT